MKRIETMLSELAALGVRLRLEGDQLHYRAPRGVLVGETLAALRERKAELIAFLKSHAAGEEGADVAAQLPPLVARGLASGPLSLGQQSLWVLDQLHGPGNVYNVPEVLTLRGPLDREALEHSLSLILARQALLRARILEDEGGVFLKFAARSSFSLPLVDISHLPPTRRREQAEELVAKEVGYKFSLRDHELFRSCLLRLGPQEHIFSFTMHHVIADGWSKGIMGRELSAAYRACRLGEKPAWQPLALNYLDYTRWQQELLEGGVLNPQLAYWRRQLKELPAPASIPPDFQRPERLSGRGGVVVRELPGRLSRELKALARQQGATLYMVLAAVFSELLRRYRGDGDIVFGTPVANRPSRELQDLLGFFVNNLVMRLQAEGKLSFNELLTRLRQTVLAAFTHQLVPFEKVVEAVAAPRALNFTPLFQIGFVLQDGTIAAPELDGLEVEPWPLNRDSAKYDLSLIIVESGEGLVLEWEYSSDLFAAETIVQLGASFAQLAHEIVLSPTAPLQTLESCDPAQRQLVLEDWSRSGSLPLPELSLPRLLARTAAQYPQRTALVVEQRQLTYRQLDRRAHAIARALRHLGVGEGSLVALALERSSLDLIPALLGILKAGAAYLPLEPTHPPQRLATLLADSGARVLLAGSELAAKLAPAGVTVLDPASLAAEPAETGGRQGRSPAGAGAAEDCLASEQAQAGTRPDSPDAPAYLIYTSGSTGTPKGVLIEQRAVVNLVLGLEEAIYRHYPGPQQVSLFAATIFDASVQQIFAALTGGHTLHLLPEAVRAEFGLLLDYWRGQRITIADGTPTLLALLLEAGLAEAEGLALRHLIIGGEPLPVKLLTRLKAGAAGSKIALSNVYGPTECCVDATIHSLFTDDDYRRCLNQRIVPIGRPLANVTAYILDDLLRPVAPGMPGELCLGGPGLARGYLGREDLTRQRFVANPFEPARRLYRTGDRVRFLADGSLSFLGRDDNQVKLRGFRLELGEVEEALRRCRQVQEAVVLLAGEGVEKELLAYLVAGESLSGEELRQQLALQLPAYMIPVRFFLLPSLPRNASGKLDRAALPELARTPLGADASRYQPPRGRREEELAQVWQEVLAVSRPGRDDNYFVLGGDSIKALQLVTRLRQRGWQLQIPDIFHHPTIARLAPRLQGRSELEEERGPVSGLVVLTAIQGWFLARFTPPLNHFHQAVLLRAQQRLDPLALEPALQALVDGHDLLRARFYQDREGEGKGDGAGEWRQEIAPLGQSCHFEVLTWPGAPEVGQWLRERSQALLQRTDLSRGSLFMAALYRLPDGDRLLLAAHHLVVDGVSWRILLADLQQAYRLVLAGETPGLPARTTSFSRWAEKIAAYARSLQPEDSAAGSPQLQAAIVNPPYPVRPFTYGQRRRCRCRLPFAPLRERQRELAAIDGGGLTEILLGTLVRALQRDSGSGPVALMLESHGRQPLFAELELDRTVGWFTALYPVLIDLAGVTTPQEAVKTVGRVLRPTAERALEFGLCRWGAGARSGWADAPQPAILFNYLGEFGAELESELFTLAHEELGPLIDPRARVPFAFEFTGLKLGDLLELTFEYGEINLAPAAAERLMECWREEIDSLSRHPFTEGKSAPSTTAIDYQGLERREMDSFLSHFTGSPGITDAHD